MKFPKINSAIFIKPDNSKTKKIKDLAFQAAEQNRELTLQQKDQDAQDQAQSDQQSQQQATQDQLNMYQAQKNIDAQIDMTKTTHKTQLDNISDKTKSEIQKELELLKKYLSDDSYIQQKLADIKQDDNNANLDIQKTLITQADQNTHGGDIGKGPIHQEEDIDSYAAKKEIDLSNSIRDHAAKSYIDLKKSKEENLLNKDKDKKTNKEKTKK